MKNIVLKYSNISGINYRIEKAMADKSTTTLKGNFQEFIEQYYGTFSNFVQNNNKIDDILCSIVNDIKKNMP